MKKIINRPEDVVIEMCKGIALAHPELRLNEKHKIMIKKDLNKNKVSLISGGGSGHEPAHAGFIGKGMLDAAVCGDVFASPSQIQVYEAIKETASDRGTLLIIKNYSGDMMNFKNAAHLASEDEIAVKYVKVDDDIAVNDSLYTVGRRGVAGTVFVHKMAGAKAEQGASLDEVTRVAQKCADNVRSLGFALTSCTVPAKGTPTFDISDNELEFGAGIHGEPGIRREEMSSSSELASRIVNSICESLNVKAGDELAILVNGFGATPLQELYLFNHDVRKQLETYNVSIERTFVGNYMTSIDMAGASLSILKLDDELKALLAEQAKTPAFNVDGPVSKTSYSQFAQTDHVTSEVSYTVETDCSYSQIKNERLTLENMIYLVDKMSEVIIENEVPFCELDSHAGDGDFGMSVAKGFKELKKVWHEILAQKELNISSFLDQVSLVIMENCGGASGPIWGSAFRGASKAVSGKDDLTVADFTTMLVHAVTAIQQTGERSFGRGAVVGDKTLIDALVPCVDSWEAHQDKTFMECFDLGAKAAVLGAEKTKEISARMGRAGTVGDRSIGHPDAGAHGLGVIFTALSEALN